jgi:hypothetical protein
MSHLLVMRETLIQLFKRFEIVILPVLKFFFGVYIFQKINQIGYMNPALTEYADALPSIHIEWLLGLGFVLLPLSVSWLLIILCVTLQFSAGIEVAAVVFLFLMLVYLLYARMAVKESILILLTVLAFHFNAPYLLPLLVGLYGAPTAIIPVTIGIFINSHIPVIQSLAATTKTAGLELTELPATFTEVYTTLLTSLSTTQSWLFTAFIFAMVIIVVHVVSRLSIDFAKELSILLGCILMIFSFIMAVLVAGESVNIGGVILGSVICAALAELVRLFDPILDFQRAESVQFEDDNNYYYVRMVPKILMTKRKRVVRRIRPQREETEEE